MISGGDLREDQKTDHQAGEGIQKNNPFFASEFSSRILSILSLHTILPLIAEMGIIPGKDKKR
jgi:hypothetical protein